jgi:hypothetical protein
MTVLSKHREESVGAKQIDFEHAQERDRIALGTHVLQGRERQDPIKRRLFSEKSTRERRAVVERRNGEVPAKYRLL